jgi:Type II intron maturase
MDESDFGIIQLYGLEYRGIVQYYAYARNRHWLTRLHWVMRTSLLNTLANKHRSTVSKMARKFAGKAITKTGIVKCLTITVEREGKAPLYAQFGGLSLTPEPAVIIEDQSLNRDRIHDARNELITRLLADECELCGSKEQVEGHHIRKLADLQVDGRKNVPRWKQKWHPDAERPCSSADTAARRSMPGDRHGRPKRSVRITGEPCALRVARTVRGGRMEKVSTPVDRHCRRIRTQK